MKNRIGVIAIIVLALVLSVCYFIPYYKQEEIIILSPIIRPARALNTLTEWLKWNPALKTYCAENPSACAITENRALNTFAIQSKQVTFEVNAKGAVYYVKELNGSHSTTYNYTLVPTLYNDTTRVIIAENTNLLLSFLLTGESNAHRYADSLKSYIENPSSYYGFPLQILPVVDTVVVTAQLQVPAVNTTLTLKSMYKTIGDYIQTNHLTITQPPIAHFKPFGKDSMEITAGVPVNKTIPQTSTKNNVYFMKMPPQGHMLVGYYKGNFSGRIKLYQAMDRLLNDKFLHKAAVGFEKYIDGRLPDNDNSPVEIKVYYPIL